MSPTRRSAQHQADSSADQTTNLQLTDSVTNGSASATLDNAQDSGEPVIDPELADLPAPPHHNGPEEESVEAGGMSITESIAQAPNPRPADFSMLPLTNEDIDLSALDAASVDGPPGSPTARLLKAIAPPNAAQPDPKWPPPPHNASVNLFIGRALLSNGNDNWPLKPNDIVNWIRKHYPAQWDGDEGRCSAHRVRTYLARKGADMYYEKLNQGCIAGWRIRQNHLWRFENGGFLGRGMKQEEAIAQAAKENEAIATAAHKAAAAEALAAGHPGVKVSMSAPGVSDGMPPPKRQRVKAGPGQARRKNNGPKAKNGVDLDVGDVSLASAADGDASFYQTGSAHDDYSQPASAYDNQAGPSNESAAQVGADIDPTLMTAADGDDNQVDPEMLQRAMQGIAAANAGQMEDLEMGMQLPIEMQMHGGGDDERGDFYGAGTGEDAHPYTPHGSGFEGDQFGYTTNAQGQVYGSGYQGGQ